jgi:SAM-dependent methyltransferase
MDGEPMTSAATFGASSACYDLLYADKDYATEADHIAGIVRSVVPDARRILEFGSGTGRHGRLLAERGFDVRGIERSPDMLAIARSRCGMVDPLRPTNGVAGSFVCSLGDVRTAHEDGTFDAVVALFHVMSYQIEDASLQATFANAARQIGRAHV